MFVQECDRQGLMYCVLLMGCKWPQTSSYYAMQSITVTNFSTIQAVHQSDLPVVVPELAWAKNVKYLYPTSITRQAVFIYLQCHHS